MQKSAGGIIFHGYENPRFLLLKRQALTKIVEWVAPKGKIMENEDPIAAAIREISEEVNIPSRDIKLLGKVGNLAIHLKSDKKNAYEKEVQFFLFEHIGNMDNVKIQPGEGFVGVYKWATIDEVLSLIHFENLRELFRKSYKLIKSTSFS